MKNNRKPVSAATPEDIRKSEKLRKKLEGTATFGLILVAVGLAAPFTDLTNGEYIKIFKWIYAPGALIFTVARVMGATDPLDSLRVRRLRRLEFWAGIALCVGAFFWFFNEHRYADLLSNGYGAMVYLKETVIFSLVGALIQVIASWMISFRVRKEARQTTGDGADKK